jgi:hypothetical protein
VLTGDNDKNKIQRIKAFSKYRFLKHHTIGGFYAPIKVNKTSVSNNNFQHRLLQK